jgi:hypothetical protein
MDDMYLTPLWILHPLPGNSSQPTSEISDRGWSAVDAVEINRGWNAVEKISKQPQERLNIVQPRVWNDINRGVAFNRTSTALFILSFDLLFW